MQTSPDSIFICYRREDSADVTGRIYDRLVDHFGPERVFIDVEAIRLGYDFRSEIDQTIKVCSIVIVVIGDKWLAQVDGKRRIDDENDRVRIEIEAALRREIPIIPILARGASRPTKEMLPASLEALAYRHGTSIRHEHFRGDVDFLISQMDNLLARRESTPSKPAQSKDPQWSYHTKLGQLTSEQSNQEKYKVARLKNYLEERKTRMNPWRKIRRIANRNAIAEAEALELLRRDADVEFKRDEEGDLCAKIKSWPGNDPEED